MNSFKHYHDLSQKPEIARFFDLCEDVHTGFGFLVMLMQVICRELHPKRNPTRAVRLSKESWCRAVCCHRNRWEKYIVKARVAGVVNTRVSKRKGRSIIEVRMPLMLELTDEYFKKSGHRPDNVQTSQSLSQSEESIHTSSTHDSMGEGNGNTPKRKLSTSERTREACREYAKRHGET